MLRTVIHQKASLDLWPRAWVWVEFVSSHREVLQVRPEDSPLYSAFVLLFERFLVVTDAAALVDSIPRVHVVIGKAWLIFLGLRYKVDGMDGLGGVIGRGIVPAEHLEEYIEVAGGGVHDLASLVVQHIYLAIAPQAITRLDCVMAFPNAIDPTHPIHATFAANGIVKALVWALYSPTNDSNMLRPLCMLVLR
jgi:hypothetical protein